MAGAKTGKNIPAPGAMTSPQMPGATPNYTTIAGHIGEATPPASAKTRPLSQYGTAEEIAAVFKKKPMHQIQPEDFEQANASGEELRKVSPANLTPIRPLPGPGSNPAIAAGGTSNELASGE
jgi:hypothetical protein